MALFHVEAGTITKGQCNGGAVGFAAYLTRGDDLPASVAKRYLERDGHDAADLVAQDSEALPSWARDGANFWLCADRYERANARIAQTYRFTIPWELSDAGRLSLAEDVRAVFFARYPHTWAVHAPKVHESESQGDERRREDQPHLHILVSARREDVPSDRTPKEWFARAANPGHDPLSGGVRKDPVWREKRMLQGLRAEYAVLVNAALEREGHKVAVSHERLSVRGYWRDAERVLPRAQIVLLKKYVGQELGAISNPKVRAKVCEAREAMADIEVDRALLHLHYHPMENARNLEAWQTQKTREGIGDLSREAVVDHVRDRFWLRMGDRSPAREQERADSIARRIAREHLLTGRPLQGRRLERQRAMQRLGRELSARLRGVQDEEEGHGAPLAVRLGEERERSRGVGY